MSIAIRHDPAPVVPPYDGIYAYGVETASGARTLRISGQVGVAFDGHLPTDFEGQCRQAIANLDAVLRCAGMTLSNIVQMTFYMTRPSDMPQLLNVRKALLEGVRPAITTLLVAGLVSADWLIEIEAVACA